MTALTSYSLVAPMRQGTTVLRGLVRLCVCLLVLDCVTAKHTPSGNNRQFTEFGERCSGDGCHFDEAEVGTDVRSFCLTTATGGGHAVQLVKPSANHLGLEVVDEGLQLLRTFPKPLAIITAIGSFKTGKSFFMNVLNEHVLCGDGDSLDGFHVDDTVSAATRGIWMWSKPIEVDCEGLKARINEGSNDQSVVEQLTTMVDTLLGGTLKATLTSQDRIDISNCKVDKVNLVLLDVEGFNSIDGFQQYDEALFTIASMLSTELIYFSHKVVDARDIMELQNMLQMANATIVNIHRSLSNAPEVFITENGMWSAAEGFSVIHQTDAKECGRSKKDKSITPRDHNEMTREMIPELQRNTGLTIAVQGFTLQLQQSALDYVNQIVNGKRFDLSYKNRKSFFEYIGQLRDRFLSFFGDDPHCKDMQGCPEHMMNDQLSRLTSSYQYVIPHVFGSIDVLLTSTASKEKSAALLKENLVRGYLEQIQKYKTRLFKRVVMNPKKRFSPVMESMTLMSGDDLGDVLDHLVNSINKAMKSGSMDYWGDVRVTRANLVKRDLLDLYAGELWELVHRKPIPLQGELESFSENTKNKYIKQLSLYAEYDLRAEQFGNLRTDFENLIDKTVNDFRHVLHKITLAYCQAKVSGVKKSVREHIERFQLPVLPATIKELEGNKEELLALYVEAIDENAIKYSTSAACKYISHEVSNYINEVIEELHKENDNEITMLFQEATRRAVEFFISNADRNAVEKYRVNHKEFVETLDAWISGAYNTFYGVVGEFRTLNKFSSAPLSFLKKQISLFEKEARDH